MARYALFICLLALGCAARPAAAPTQPAVSPQVRIRYVSSLDAVDLEYTSRLINLKFVLDDAIEFHADEIRALNASIDVTQEVKGMDIECLMLKQQVTALTLDVVGMDVQAEYIAAVTNIYVQHYLITGSGGVPNKMIRAYDLLQDQLQDARGALIRAQLKFNRCAFPERPQPKIPQAAAQSLSLADLALP